jgi:Poly(ADP-ribose) polymerase catalytic domain
VCGERLEGQRDVLTICKKKECKKRLESLIVGNYVVSWLRDKTELAHIHLIIGYKAFKSARWRLIAHPRPVYFDEHEDLLAAIIPLTKLFSEMYDNDEQLAKAIGEPSYVLIKFILMTAPLLEVVPDSPKGCKIYAVPNVETIIEPVFHGSGEENWYSIIRNGLKACSGTAWQSSGAAHGSGIYLGKTLSISVGYSHGDQIVGVYKWTNGSSGYKGNNIFVVEDDSFIELQYLVVSKQLTTEIQSNVIKKIKN